MIGQDPYDLFIEIWYRVFQDVFQDKTKISQQIL